MDRRLSKAKAAFRKLRGIWSSKQYNRRTKTRLFNTLVKLVKLVVWKGDREDQCPRQ